MKLDLKATPARCGGKGYHLKPADPTVWDVATVRVDCRGCVDCLKPGEFMIRNDQQLHYEHIAGTLLRREGKLHWRCPDCGAQGASKEALKVCPKCKGRRCSWCNRPIVNARRRTWCSERCVKDSRDFRRTGKRRVPVYGTQMEMSA